MNNGGEAADQVMSMSLRALEVMAKISGAGAKNLATYLYAVLTSTKKTRGKARLESMLRSGKELKVFAVRNDDLKMFTQEAKKYGVLYCALKDKNNIDGMCDIMVRAEDASKINRIVERFNLATVDTATIESTILKDKAEKSNAPEKTDKLVDQLLGGQSDSPLLSTTEKKNPSNDILESIKTTPNSTKRKSVRAELFEIKQSQQTKFNPVKPKAKTYTKSKNNSKTTKRKMKGKVK